MHDNPAAAKLLQGFGFINPYSEILLNEEGEIRMALDEYVLGASRFRAQLPEAVKKRSEKNMRPSSV